MLGTGLVCRNEREIDFCLHRGRQFDLGFLSRFLQPLQSHLVFRQVDALILFELFNDPFDQALVDVVATEVRITIRRFDFDNALADFEDRNVIGAAAKVEDGDGFILFLVETVSQGCRRRLVDDAHDFEARNLAGVLGRLALRVVEIRRHGDHSFLDLLAKLFFGRLLHLLKNHGRDFRRTPFLAASAYAHVTTGAAALYFVRDLLFLLGNFVEATTHESLD